MSRNLAIQAPEFSAVCHPAVREACDWTVPARGFAWRKELCDLQDALRAQGCGCAPAAKPRQRKG
jgi:hypothetical protein